MVLSYKSSESKGHQTNNNETNCNNGYHSCTVSHIKTQKNFSVKSFNPAVISDIKIDSKSLIQLQASIVFIAAVFSAITQSS